MSPVPVIDLSNGPNYGTQSVPLFAVGLGRTSELVLVNPTGSILTGTVQFLDPYGAPVFVSLGSAYTWNAAYAMAPNSSQKLVMTDVIGGFGYGSVRVVSDAGQSRSLCIRELQLFTRRAPDFRCRSPSDDGNRISNARRTVTKPADFHKHLHRQSCEFWRECLVLAHSFRRELHCKHESLYSGCGPAYGVPGVLAPRREPGDRGCAPHHNRSSRRYLGCRIQGAL